MRLQRRRLATGHAAGYSPDNITPNHAVMDSQDRDQVEAIIRQMVDANPMVINAVIAEEVSERLGKPVRKDRIARIRRGMGLGMVDQVAKDMAHDLANMA